MEIVAAAVHDSIHAGQRPIMGRLLLGNGVNVRPQGHRAAGLSAPQQSHNAGLHPQVHQFQTQLCQLFLQKGGGAFFLKAQLRVAVQLIFEVLQRSVHGLGLIQQFHIIPSFPSCGLLPVVI